MRPTQRSSISWQICALTPSAAAELAVADVRAVLNTLENYKSRMNHAMANQTQRARSRLLQYETKWKYLGPENKIRDQRARHAELERRYTDAMEEETRSAALPFTFRR